MDNTQVAVSTDWPEAAQYTASGETDIKIVGNEVHPIYWLVGDTKPTVDVTLGAYVPARGGEANLTLPDGSKLWLASPHFAGQVTLIYQA